MNSIIPSKPFMTFIYCRIVISHSWPPYFSSTRFHSMAPATLLIEASSSYPSITFEMSPMFQNTTDSHWSNQPVASTAHHGYPAPSVHRGSTAVIDLRDVDGRTPLVRAVVQGKRDEVRSLLSNGAA